MLQVVWDLVRKEERMEIAPYRKPTAPSQFVSRPSIRSRRVKVYSREEVVQYQEKRRVKA